MRITFKKYSTITDYSIDDKPIPIQSVHKHLGLLMDNKLKFTDHVEFVYNKSMRKWATLKKLFPYAKSDILIKLYTTYIIPIIDYKLYLFLTKCQPK